MAGMVQEGLIFLCGVSLPTLQPHFSYLLKLFKSSSSLHVAGAAITAA